MKLTQLDISDVIVIEPEAFKDDRGFFFEAYNQEKFNKALGKEINFVQDNQSFSKKGVLRGLHFQKPPFQQAKLVRVLKGEIYDVCVDLRINSSTFGEWVGCFLSENNYKQLFVPAGFAHGFLVTGNEAQVLYKVDNQYNSEHEECLIYNDAKLNIAWPVTDILTSEKDKKGKNFKDVFKFDF